MLMLLSELATKKREIHRVANSTVWRAIGEITCPPRCHDSTLLVPPKNYECDAFSTRLSGIDDPQSDVCCLCLPAMAKLLNSVSLFGCSNAIGQ
jgi:hypothetical protein